MTPTQQARGLAYRSGDEATIRLFFPSLPRNKQDFWCEVYTAVRVLTSSLYSHSAIIDLSLPEPPDDKDADTELLSWWGLACRAQFWLDRHGIKVLPHKGQYIRCGLVYTVKKEYYA